MEKTVKKEYGFIKVTASSIEVEVANTDKNTDIIIEEIIKAEKSNSTFIVFPELAITGYTCADLFLQDIMQKEVENSLKRILEVSRERKITILVGAPLYVRNALYNCAVVINNGEILGINVKTYVPNYNEYYEKRWFASANNLKEDKIKILNSQVPIGNDIIYENDDMDGLVFGVEICEDLWSPIPPSTNQALSGANIIFNLSASNEVIGKADYRKELVLSQSGKTITGYVYVSAGCSESTTDLVYGGHIIMAENNKLLAESERFIYETNRKEAIIDLQKIKHDRMNNSTYTDVNSEHVSRKVRYFDLVSFEFKYCRKINSHPFVPGKKSNLNKRCKEIFNIQTFALQKRINHIGIKKVVIGVSGGLDSTLALLVAQKTFKRLNISTKNIIAVTMPGFGTTDETYENACALIEGIGCDIIKIDIKNACMMHFKDIGHDPKKHDVTYENVQARERTQILMDIANKESAIVIGTGDLSEIALGWSTYNGDHMSMYAVNCSIPKTLVKFLINWVADNEVSREIKQILYSVINTPISPELLPPSKEGEISQKTENIVGPYELHDFFLYNMFRYGMSPNKIQYLTEIAYKNKYSSETIAKWLKIFYIRFFSSQFKRSCIPDGPKVGSIALSPRGDLRMPSDSMAKIWIKDIENKKK